MARFLLLPAVVLGLLIAAPPASSAPRAAIIRDCEDDSKLSGTYTARELRDARSNLPSDTDAYSDCRDVLGAALAASAARGRAGAAGGSGSSGGNALEGGSTGGSSSGGSGTSGGLAPAPALDIAPGAGALAPTEPEKQALRTSRATPPDAGAVAGVRAVAGQAATATIPTSLVLVLVLLGVTIVLAAIPHLRRRVLRRRAA